MYQILNCSSSRFCTNEAEYRFQRVKYYRLYVAIVEKQMELPGETVQMEDLVAVEGENTLRRIGAGPFWEVRI